MLLFHFCQIPEQQTPFSWFFHDPYPHWNIILVKKTTHKQQREVDKVELIRFISPHEDGKVSPSSRTSRLPEREAAGRLKCCYMEASDWLRGGRDDVRGPSGAADWSAVWSDDSETAGPDSTSQSQPGRSGRSASNHLRVFNF